MLRFCARALRIKLSDVTHPHFSRCRRPGDCHLVGSALEITRDHVLAQPTSLTRPREALRAIHSALHSFIGSYRETWSNAELSGDLVQRSLVAGCVGIKVRFADFITVTRDLTLDAAIANAGAIRLAPTERLGPLLPSTPPCHLDEQSC